LEAADFGYCGAGAAGTACLKIAVVSVTASFMAARVAWPMALESKAPSPPPTPKTLTAGVAVMEVTFTAHLDV